jgi:hypothetical protein
MAEYAEAGFFDKKLQRVSAPNLLFSGVTKAGKKKCGFFTKKSL